MPSATLSLMEHTRTLLNESSESLGDIAAALHEKGVKFYWLRKFKHGEFEDPSVNKVQVLYEYLTGQPLLG